MIQEQKLFTILSSMILNKVYCRLDKESKFKDSLFRVQGIQLLDSGKYLILLECMDDPNGRFVTSDILKIKPYLRPMSSMTEEEFQGLRSICPHANFNQTNNPEWVVGISGSDYGRISRVDEISRFIDWLNAHHFDYRGLIPMGLAIEEPEGMYD